MITQSTSLAPEEGGRAAPQRPSIQTKDDFFTPGPWAQGALLGLLVLPGTIMIFVLLAGVLLAAIPVFLVQMIVRPARGSPQSHSNIMAGR